MARPQTLFFDMDDTLIDSLSASRASWESVGALYAARAGVDTTTFRDALLAEAREFWRDEAKVGHWRIDLTGARVYYTRAALIKHGWDESMAEEIAMHYDDVHMSSLEVFPDSLKLIDDLRGKGFRLGLITNGPQSLQRRKIAKFDFTDLFDVIVIEGEFGRGKPERAVFEHALSATGTQPEYAWHTGDNQYADIGGAQSAGVRGVWIHRERLELEPAHPTPDHVIGHLEELLQALEA